MFSRYATVDIDMNDLAVTQTSCNEFDVLVNLRHYTCQHSITNTAKELIMCTIRGREDEQTSVIPRRRGNVIIIARVKYSGAARSMPFVSGTLNLGNTY